MALAEAKSAYLEVDLLNSSILSSPETMHDAVVLQMPLVDFVLEGLLLDPLKKEARRLRQQCESCVII